MRKGTRLILYSISVFLLMVSGISFAKNEVRGQKSEVRGMSSEVGVRKVDTSVIKELIKYSFEDAGLVPFAIYESMEALEMAKKIKYEKGIEEIFKQVSSIKYQVSRNENCSFQTLLFDRILNYNVNVYMTLYDSLGYYYSKHNQQDKALGCFQNVETLASENDLRLTTYDLRLSKSVLNGMAGCYKKIGIQYINQEDYEISIEYSNKALNIYKRLENKLGICSCYNNIGVAYMNLNKNSFALDYLLKSLKIDEDLKYKTGLANCNMNIGIIYIKEKDYKKAMDFNQKALNIFEEIKNKASILNCYGNFGTIYSNQGNYKKAIEYSNQALKISEELQDEWNTAYILNDIGEAYMNLEDYSKALAYFTESLKINNKINDKINKLYIFKNIANTYFKLKKYDNALEYVLISSKSAKELKLLDIENDGYRILKEIYKYKGDYKKVSEYADLYKITSDSLYNVKKSKQIFEIQNKFETEKKDKDIKLLKKNNEINTIKIGRQKVFIRYMIVGFVLLIFMILLILRNLKTISKNKKLLEKLHEQEKLQIKTESEVKEAELQRNKAEIELKKKNLEYFSLRIVEKNDFIKNIEKEIDTLEGTENDRRQLLNISNKIRNQIAVEREVYDIENKINEAYSGFLKKLNEKHPDLTKTEKKICSLMLLNFDNKQISILLNINPESLRKYRQRLRKKLRLNLEDDTVNYLKSL